MRSGICCVPSVGRCPTGGPGHLFKNAKRFDLFEVAEADSEEHEVYDFDKTK